MKPLTLYELDRLFASIDSHGGNPDVCWEWLSSLKKESGYGQIMVWGSMQLAHRIVCYLMHGDFGRLNALHRCDNRVCCNPFHLYPGTQKRNVQDALERGRYRCGGVGKFGESNPNSKYTDAQIARVRELLTTDMTQRQIAAECGVTQRLVSMLYRGVAHANPERVPERVNKLASKSPEFVAQVLELHRQGYGPYQIAQRLPIQPKSARLMIERAAPAVGDESVMG